MPTGGGRGSPPALPAADDHRLGAAGSSREVNRAGDSGQVIGVTLTSCRTLAWSDQGIGEPSAGHALRPMPSPGCSSGGSRVPARTRSIAENLTVSALVAILPLLTIFVLLGALRMKAHLAALAALGVALLVAIVAYHMPVPLALLAATEGAAFGLFPIMTIVFAAIWVYELTVVSGRFADLRQAFQLISDDPGYKRSSSRSASRAAGSARRVRSPGGDHRRDADGAGLHPGPGGRHRTGRQHSTVAFGAIATPIVTAGALTKISYEDIGAYVGRQTHSSPSSYRCCWCFSWTVGVASAPPGRSHSFAAGPGRQPSSPAPTSSPWN